jgi:hypothetical protein
LAASGREDFPFISPFLPSPPITLTLDLPQSSPPAPQPRPSRPRTISRSVPACRSRCSPSPPSPDLQPCTAAVRSLAPVPPPLNPKTLAGDPPLSFARSCRRGLGHRHRRGLVQLQGGLRRRRRPQSRLPLGERPRSSRYCSGTVRIALGNFFRVAS